MEVWMQRIRDLREERGLTQVRLAVAADMNPATLNRIEQGKANPNLKTLERLAVALGVEVADLFPKVQSPLPETDQERRTAEAEVIADYERLTREFRISWRDALNALAAPWERRLESGAFDRSMVEQFFTDVAAVSSGVSRALRATIEEETTLHLKYNKATTAEHIEEMWATAISPAGARLTGISDRVLAAAVERFPSDELAFLRSKHDVARRALRAAA
jgi:transcriptional regulator with XRE-family HTH domain